MLELGSALTTANTSFDIDSAAGSVLKIDGAVASLIALGFRGSSGALELANVSGGLVQGFNGTIAGLNVGASATVPTNKVDIRAGLTRAVLSGSTITAFNGNTVVATLALSAAPAHGAYAVVQADATLGGNDVFLSNQPPAAPATPFLTAASDSGVKGDNITNIATPVIRGTGVPGDTVTLLDGVTPVRHGRRRRRLVDHRRHACPRRQRPHRDADRRVGQYLGAVRSAEHHAGHAAAGDARHHPADGRCHLRGRRG